MISPWIVQDIRASSFRKNRHSDYLTTEFVQIASSLHGLNKTDPVVSPLFCTLGAFRNVPRTLLVWGENELFKMIDEFCHVLHEKVFPSQYHVVPTNLMSGYCCIRGFIRKTRRRNDTRDRFVLFRGT